MEDFFNSLDLSGVPWGWIGLVCGISLLVTVAGFMVRKRTANKFTQQHPDAITILLDHTPSQGKTISVITVNDEVVTQFNEGLTVAFYAVPGRNVIQAQYSTTRPGVMARTITKTWGPYKVVFELEAGKKYKMGWDEKAEQFTLNLA